jgi:hypothetical protein
MFATTFSRLSAFAALLVVVGTGAAAVGAATDPTPPLQDCLAVAATEAGFGKEQPMAQTAHGAEPMVEAIPGADGTSSTLAGVSLRPMHPAFSAGSTAQWRFTLVGCDGEPIRELEPENTKLLHLIVVRTDLTAYQHLHPDLHADGTWSVAVQTPTAGAYRAIADFVIDGRKYVLGTTLHARGVAVMAPLPTPAPLVRVDGYEVELQRPARLAPDEDAQLTFRITKHGRPVRNLQRYLGAYGHLVALRAGDLAYSHVHPAGEDRAAAAITFNAELHGRGAFRLFVQFRAGGRVHTAAFTEHVA